MPPDLSGRRLFGPSPDGGCGAFARAPRANDGRAPRARHNPDTTHMRVARVAFRVEESSKTRPRPKNAAQGRRHFTRARWQTHPRQLSYGAATDGKLRSEQNVGTSRRVASRPAMQTPCLIRRGQERAKWALPIYHFAHAKYTRNQSVHFRSLMPHFFQR